HGLFHSLTYHNAPERQVSRCYSFRKGDNVGLHVPVRHREPSPGTPEPGNDFIGNQQDVVARTDFVHARPVIGGRVDDTAGAVDWFTDEGAYGVRSFAKNRRLQFL